MTVLDCLHPPLRWLDQKLDCFNPMPESRSNFTCLKAFAELAITVMYLRQYQPKISGNVTSISQFLSRASESLTIHCERHEYLEAARREPRSAYAFILPYLSLRTLGYRSSSHEDLLRWLSSRGLLRSAEMSPYRQLDRMHFFWKSGVVKKAPWRRLYRDTTLAQRQSAVYYSDEDAYSVTHTIFYLTDFGLRDNFFTHAEEQAIATLLHALLMHSWRMRNWDLMGEILASFNFMKLPASTLKRQAETHFVALLRPDGTLPPNTPKPRPRQPRSTVPGPAGWDPYSRDCYHPTLVYLLYALSTVQA